MINRLLLAIIFVSSTLSFKAFCEVDAVDYNENYALLEEQQAAYEQPVARDNQDDERALAHDEGNTNTKSNLNLLNKVQGLQQEIQELRGQLELQAHELKLLKEQQLSFYKDLDARVQGASTKNNTINPESENNPTQKPNNTPMPVPVVVPVNQTHSEIGSERGNPADEQISYLAAYELVKNKHFDAALSAMQSFVMKYPHGGYTANAQYWLGELFMLNHDYPKAIEHFNLVLQDFPSSSKCADSLLKIGYALVASGKMDEARAKLQELIRNYPDTSTAALAKAKLESLSQR